MHKFGVVYEKHERRRAYPVLHGVIYFKSSAVFCRRLGGAHGGRNHVVQKSRRYTLFRVGFYLRRQSEQFIYSLSRLCRNIYGFEIVHKRKIRL